MHATQLSAPVVLRTAGPDDEHLLADLLASLSPTTSFHRFMTGAGVPGSTVLRSLLRTDPGSGAVLALRGQSVGARAVGHACWSVSGDVADLGVVVADDVQGQGIGTDLFAAAARAAAAAKATAVHLDVHPDNRRLVAALRRRLGPRALAWHHGLLTVDALLADVADLARPPAAAPAA
jgi:ribosomal protein S18 acetylase RimI-like enzyme